MTEHLDSPLTISKCRSCGRSHKNIVVRKKIEKYLDGSRERAVWYYNCTDTNERIFILVVEDDPMQMLRE